MTAWEQCDKVKDLVHDQPKAAAPLNIPQLYNRGQLILYLPPTTWLFLFILTVHSIKTELHQPSSL